MPRKSYVKKTNRTYRKKSTKMSLYRPKLRMLNTHHFKGHYIKADYLEVFMSGADKFFGYTFKLADLPNATEYVNLFDEYRINAVLFELKPRYNSNLIMSTDPATLGPTTNMVTANNLGIPEINTVIDYNDATAPTTVNELVEYQTYRQTRATQLHSRKLVPRYVITGGSMFSKRWLATAASNEAHYGLKGAVSNIPNISLGGSNPSFFIDLHITYYISCRNTK